MPRLLLLTLVAALIFPTGAIAEECDGDTCIEVSADDDNHLVIKVKKGKPGSTTTSSPSSNSTSTSSSSTIRKQPWIPWLPKPVATPRPKSTKITKPRVRKPRVKKISAIQLADQVKRMLPSGVILTQPTSAALLREPVNFMTTVPSSFQTVIVVLEVPILITLKATYSWDFGDGNSHTSHHPGAPYPASIITNRYQQAGEYQVELKVTWSGSWRAGTISGPIKGSITQVFERDLSIHGADTTFTR
ncbi:MAG: PKD domain-containing protein [Candidatus Nanopelagicaceae bacterium]|nr:PKD domain-containing protein [Candidatus Nanopelagicaceae bacterium]